MTAKKKTKTIAKLMEEAAVIIQKKVRLKSALLHGAHIPCASCGARHHWKEMQGGHFISRRYTKYRLEETNIHPQCRLCNGPLRGNLSAYTLYMIDMYGREYVNEMLRTKAETKKYNRTEIEEIIATEKAELKRLEALL